MEQRTKCRLSYWAGFCLLAAGLGLAGCGHREELREAAIAGAYAPDPPTFLSGPAAVLLTNGTSYSAHLELETEPVPTPENRLSGQLLVRGSQIFFAPDTEKIKDNHARAGGYGFIWDAAASKGYVLSDGLQGYAPVNAHVTPTNALAVANPGQSQKFEGYPCVLEQATVQMSNGTNGLFQVLRAPELKGVPLRITSVASTAPMTLTLSKVRFEPLAAELFIPPSDFTPYASPEAMADEVAARQHNLRRKVGEDEPFPTTEPPAATPRPGPAQ